MNELIDISLCRYFNALSKLGYCNYEAVYRLLVLIFIQELLEGDCKSFINEEDYKIIDNALYCLYGSSCLIPYPEYIVNPSSFCSGKTE